MNEGVPFFASWTAMTTHKTKGEKNLESVGKLGALENFKRKKKRQNGERKWEGCGQSRRKWSIDK